MSKEEEPVTNEEPEQNAEAEEKEEDVVDVELQKEMKGIQIVDSDFRKENNGAKKDKKEKDKDKEKEDKKSKKKKGQDFIDYANKNNIQINIEYEENKYTLKKTDDLKDNTKNYKPNEGGRGQHRGRGGFRGGYRGRGKRGGNKFSGNKFDRFDRFFAGPGYYPQNQHQTPSLTEDKEILAYIEKLFSEETLNKDRYLRNRLDDKRGYFDIKDLVNYSDISKNKISAEKIIEIVKQSPNLEIVTEGEKTFIHIKNFDTLKIISIEELNEAKKNQRMQRMNYMPQMIYPMPYNYINMQNNYIISQPIPGYNQQMQFQEAK